MTKSINEFRKILGSKESSGNPELAIKTLLKYHKGFVRKPLIKKVSGILILYGAKQGKKVMDWLILMKKELKRELIL